MKVSTFRMMQELGSRMDLQTFERDFQEEFLEEDAHEYLEKIIEEKQLTISDVCDRSGLGNYAYKLVSGVRKPSREAAVRICIGVGMTVEQTQHYLRLSQLARLDPRCRRDAAILFAMGKQMNLLQTQALLNEVKEKEL